MSDEFENKVEELCKENTNKCSGIPKNRKIVDLIEWIDSAWWAMKDEYYSWRESGLLAWSLVLILSVMLLIKTYYSK